VRRFIAGADHGVEIASRLRFSRSPAKRGILHWAAKAINSFHQNCAF
jgi:hypothetical protein